MTASAARLALDALGQLPEDELDLAGAAIQLARVDAPAADWQAASAALSEMAREAVALAAERPEADAGVRAGALAGLLAGRWGFRGDRETYDDLANANLIHVIERRRGLPVALGILWLHCARAAGWEAVGLDFPGHFLLGLPTAEGQLVLDVFAGGAPVDARTLRALLKRAGGPRAELRADMLQPMSQRRVLVRLQNNIKTRRLAAGDGEGALVTMEDLLRIAPLDPALWREAGALNAGLGRYGAALRCLDTFLRLEPQGEAAEMVRGVREGLRSRLH